MREARDGRERVFVRPRTERGTLQCLHTRAVRSRTARLCLLILAGQNSRRRRASGMVSSESEDTDGECGEEQGKRRQRPKRGDYVSGGTLRDTVVCSVLTLCYFLSC